MLEYKNIQEYSRLWKYLKYSRLSISKNICKYLVEIIIDVDIYVNLYVHLSL